MCRSLTPPNSSGNVQKHEHLLRFQASDRQGKISGVHAIVLKRLATHVVSPLTVMINESLCTRIFPEKFKVAKVIPLYKKGDNHQLSPNIPLSPVSKIFKKTVFTQVYNYFCAHKLFCESQYGFRKCHSTELAAIELVDQLSNYLDADKILVSIFLELSKAFDTLNHIFLYKNSDIMAWMAPSWTGFVPICMIDSNSLSIYDGACSDV